MSIANNQTAKSYDNLQKSIDWQYATTESKINVLEIMAQLLTQCPSSTPIVTDDLLGHKYDKLALQVLDSVNLHLISARQ